MEQDQAEQTLLLTTMGKIKFIEVLAKFFPDKDFSQGSKFYEKAEMTFGLFISNKWTVKQFQKVMQIFMIKHNKNYWNPADFFEIWNDNFKEAEMSYL